MPPMLRLLPLLPLLLLLQPRAGLAERRRAIARLPGDIIVGALFPIHESPTGLDTYVRKCGRVREHYGMHRVEVLMKTIREINDDPKILPGLKIGLDIRDSCWYAPIALEQSIDFIRNSLAYADRHSAGHRGGRPGACEDVGNNTQPIAALIGPGGSDVTIQVQNLLQLFKIPQIGYSATSTDLSKKDAYKYFLRVVASDTFQATAMFDVVRQMGWTYVSLLHTEGNYGAGGIRKIKELIDNDHRGEHSICIDQERHIASSESLAKFQELAHGLFNSSEEGEKRAKVVLCFCEGETVRMLFQVIKELNYAQQGFVIFGSDGWADRLDVLGDVVDQASGQRAFSEAAVGSLSIRLTSPPVPHFNEFWFGLRPDRNPDNPWFREFWEEKFNCSLTGEPGRRMCSGHEDLSKGFKQDTKLGLVVNAAWTVAYALHDLHLNICMGAAGPCKGYLPVNGTLLLDKLMKTNFLTYTNESLAFDDKGDPPGRYEILNYQKVSLGNQSHYYEYMHVGNWAGQTANSSQIVIDRSLIRWPKGRASIQSYCRAPCRVGEIRVVATKRKKCCWRCKSCDETSVVTKEFGEEQCTKCDNGTRPNDNHTACEVIPIDYLHWQDTEAIVAVAFSCLGMLVTLWVVFIICKYYNTPVVKASTRELMHFILFGILLSYLTTFALVHRPTVVSCYLSRTLPGLSLSFIYGALVTKTNRIARILAGSKKKIMTRKPRFLNTGSQIVITCLIIGLELGIVVAMLIREKPDAVISYEPKFRVLLVCNTSPAGVMVPLGFDGFLIILCTLYAIRTRNLPENFNEAKFIGFTMYTTCVIWLSFVPIYFGSENKVTATCLSMSLSATVALALLFAPKLYIILFKPEKNSRSAFSTTKEVRCHIGHSNNYNSSKTSNKHTTLHDSHRDDSEVALCRRGGGGGCHGAATPVDHRDWTAACVGDDAEVVVVRRSCSSKFVQTGVSGDNSGLRWRGGSGGSGRCPACGQELEVDCNGEDDLDDDVNGDYPLNHIHGSAAAVVTAAVASAASAAATSAAVCVHAEVSSRSSPTPPPPPPSAVAAESQKPLLAIARCSLTSSESSECPDSRGGVGGSTGRRSMVSLENLSVGGMKSLEDDEQKMRTFHQFMEQHGLQFDMDSVDTSDL